MPMKADDIVAMIKTALPDAQVELTDLAGDDNHFQAHIYSESFAGKSRIEQHKMVYTALGDKMGGDLHALSIKTFSSR
ncbi:MAG: BolA family transcriptional regulator [Alphaproteobacteria bacterium]|nr:BolA family transcriptional regulator [Alphaproteobacteria bacterium]